MSDTDATDATGWMIFACASITFQLIRLSMDLIQTASLATSKDYKEDHHGVNTKPTTATATKPTTTSYGSVASSTSTNSTTTSKEGDEGDSEQQALLLASSSSSTSNTSSTMATARYRGARLSLGVQALLAIALLVEAIAGVGVILTAAQTGAAVVVVGIGTLLTGRDVARRRLGVLSRLLYGLATLSLWSPMAVSYFQHRTHSSVGDELVFNQVSFYGILAIAEIIFVEWPEQQGSNTTGSPKKKRLSRAAMLTMLKPYFWPDETASSSSSWANMNRIRAVLTWVCVILSKCCNLVAPILLGWASTALAHEQYQQCMVYSCGYAGLQFLGSAFKEGQSLIYLKVAQAAFVQLSETTFVHLHSLSLDWHLRKKLGEVIRSMDRGIAACDTLMKYLFLWLVPALAECLVVCIIVAAYFQYVPLAVAIFYFVFFYIVWTIVVTLWRKKFRKAVVQSDNEWHDRCTDSLLQFETVKFFTAEDYERQRFGASVQKYQAGSVNVQASLSFLNISQKFILQVCLATALSMSAMGIQQRIDCCIEEHGCASGVSECCQAIDNDTCPGMQVGDFVAILTYTLQLFAPLNFLGSVYNAVVMAIIDLTNLSELLAEDPDVTDAPDALPLPLVNNTSGEPTNDDNDDDDDNDVAVEFDNVVFHYPTQPATKGLKGVSFKMKRGTTTAIVGPTGAGKTTISRLFFRFYDVLGGAVKVNGIDVRSITQKSLRGAIGVVPQTASMFNDTIRANLRYGRRDATDEELRQAAKDAQLLDFIESLEKGWDTSVGDRGLKLSGGEKQRAAIARCLLKDPPFVLLDEATSALDTLTENSVQEALDRLGNQRTVLVIAHRLGTIRNADNILVLKDGVVAEEGTHEELVERNGVYAEMWNMQLHSSTASTSGSQVNLTGLEE